LSFFKVLPYKKCERCDYINQTRSIRNTQWVKWLLLPSLKYMCTCIYTCWQNYLLAKQIHFKTNQVLIFWEIHFYHDPLLERKKVLWLHCMAWRCHIEGSMITIWTHLQMFLNSKFYHFMFKYWILLKPVLKGRGR
jgi:hypothetical protein